MDSRVAIIRTLSIGSAAAIMAAGLFLAARGGNSEDEGGLPAQAAEPSGAVTAGVEAPTAATAVTGTDLPPLGAVTQVSPGAPTAPATAAGLAIAQPRTSTATPSPTSGAQPITDIPKYTDLAVLNLAADARLPSGRTFRACVELPPSHEKWPTPVHLYYEGNGKWLVETHISEVQVEFDEATATFTTKNFQPPSVACLTAP